MYFTEVYPTPVPETSDFTKQIATNYITKETRQFISTAEELYECIVYLILLFS